MRSSTLMAFDFGLQNIGVAVGETGLGTAPPLTLLKARDGEPDWRTLARLIGEWRPARLVVGMPLNMDGTESDMSRRARRFGRELHGRFGLPVLGADERLSTHEAEARTVGERKKRVDDLAAEIILQSYLEDPDAAVALA